MPEQKPQYIAATEGAFRVGIYKRCDHTNPKCRVEYHHYTDVKDESVARVIVAALNKEL